MKTIIQMRISASQKSAEIYETVHREDGMYVGSLINTFNGLLGVIFSAKTAVSIEKNRNNMEILNLSLEIAEKLKDELMAIILAYVDVCARLDNFAETLSSIEEAGYANTIDPVYFKETYDRLLDEVDEIDYRLIPVDERLIRVGNLLDELV